VEAEGGVEVEGEEEGEGETNSNSISISNTINLNTRKISSIAICGSAREEDANTPDGYHSSDFRIYISICIAGCKISIPWALQECCLSKEQ
jgi:hypothetical protein